MSGIDKILEEHSKAIAEMQEARKKASEKIQAILHDLFKNFFEKTPEMEYITWTGYTPYWNDGEECTYRVSEKIFVLTSLAKDSGEWYDQDYYPVGYGAEDIGGFYVSKYSRDRDIEEIVKHQGIERGQVIYNNIVEMSEILEKIDDDIYKDAFGEHAAVIVNKDQILVEEYVHD